jgi:mRNA interferase MazF
MRGDVHRLRAPSHPNGHEQRGVRYGVVVQSDDLMLSTVLVAPTSTVARPATFRPEIDLEGVTTRVLVEQLAAVDSTSRLGEFVGRLTAGELAAVDRALQVVLGLLFVSSGFAPTQTMAAGLRAFADNQPMTPIINAIRAAQMNQPSSATGLAFAWAAAIVVLFAVLAHLASRHKAQPKA